jgi:hypothetical protein
MQVAHFLKLGAAPFPLADEELLASLRGFGVAHYLVVFLVRN